MGVQPSAASTYLGLPLGVHFNAPHLLLCCFAGHQFEHFSGQLGDGAAVYLGEVGPCFWGGGREGGSHKAAVYLREMRYDGPCLMGGMEARVQGHCVPWRGKVRLVGWGQDLAHGLEGPPPSGTDWRSDVPGQELLPDHVAPVAPSPDGAEAPFWSSGAGGPVPGWC